MLHLAEVSLLRVVWCWKLRLSHANSVQLLLGYGCVATRLHFNSLGNFLRNSNPFLAVIMNTALLHELWLLMLIFFPLNHMLSFNLVCSRNMVRLQRQRAKSSIMGGGTCNEV